MPNKEAPIPIAIPLSIIGFPVNAHCANNVTGITTNATATEYPICRRIFPGPLFDSVSDSCVFSVVSPVAIFFLIIVILTLAFLVSAKDNCDAETKRHFPNLLYALL